jgi:hypothetical protein
MKRALAALLMLSCATVADDVEHESGDAPAAAPTLLAEVERIAERARDTRYEHHTVVDEARGVFHVDCSGLVDYALRRTNPAAYRALPRTLGRRPLAQDFVEAFRHPSAEWFTVADARALVPGDLVAWLEPADSDGKNTGHVMVVAGAVRAQGARVQVPVIDSTRRGHGGADARRDGVTGVGRGEISLEVDGEGRPMAFWWSHAGRRRETTVALGRLR